MAQTIANEGFRRATSHEERVHEAAKLFAAGKSGADHFAQSRLLEAFTTSDFPVLLGDAFTQVAVKAQQDAVKEFEPILFDTTVDDFRRHKLVDLWSNDAFEPVAEGEEYKGGTLSETDVDHGTGKHGKVYGLTYEARRNRNFSALANFPKILGNGSIKGQNQGVASTLVTDAGAWNPDVFGDTIGTEAFTPEALDAAIKAIGQRTNHRDELVDTSNLVLIHGPGLRGEVNRVLNAARIVTEVTSGSKVTKTEVDNPFRGIVTALESRTVAARLSNPNGWALVQSKDSDLPSIIRTLLSGEETVDIRVKRDQGATVGGGDLPVDAGSFKDDTIWFRGRDFWGIDPAFVPGNYASAGSA